MSDDADERMKLTLKDMQMTTEQETELIENKWGWEHKFLKHRDPATLQANLDEAGLEGWELVNTYFHPEGQTHAFLRRRIMT